MILGAKNKMVAMIMMVVMMMVMVVMTMMVVMVILMTHQDVALIMVIHVTFQLTETRLEALSSAHHLHRFISYSLFVNTGFIHRQRSMTIKASTSSSESFS